jgi:hypothetical protein
MKHRHQSLISERLPLAALFLIVCLPLRPLVAQSFGPLADPSAPAAPATAPTAGMASTITPTLAPDQRPKDARTVIESEAGATFENATSTAEFNGHVIVHDPQFDLSCDKLHVILGADRKGLSKVIATGSVIITQAKKNDHGDIIKSIGKCGKATYDAVSGDVTMEDWPQIQQGINNQVATQQSTVMILNAKGRSRTIGGSRTMIVDQGQSGNAVTP